MIQSGIYAILNLLNGKRYIGSAVNFEGRRQNHFRKLRKGIHKNAHLQNAFNKYGENAFGWIIFEYIRNLELLISRENLYLDMFWPSGLLYNSCSVAGSTLGYKYTEEQCRKSSETMLELWATEEYRQAHHGTQLGRRSPMKGKRHSAETKRKNSESHMGKRNHMYGKHHTTESKRKNSEAHKGKCFSAETRRRMSESAKRRWARHRQERTETP